MKANLKELLVIHRWTNDRLIEGFGVTKNSDFPFLDLSGISWTRKASGDQQVEKRLDFWGISNLQIHIGFVIFGSLKCF